jgi:hypothetical protein
VALSCNHSYSGGRDHGLKPALAHSFPDLKLEKTPSQKWLVKVPA